MTKFRLVLLCFLLADIGFGAGFAFDRWLHRPIEVRMGVDYCMPKTGTQI